MYGTPSLSVKKIKANYAIRIDVRVHGDRVGGIFEEDDFRGFYMRQVSDRVHARWLDISIPIG